MEREYTVIVYNREDLPVLEAELTASTGDGPIPARRVDIANSRPGSKIQTHFALTDDEAEALRADPRVRAVEIPPDQRDDIQIGLHSTQDADFRRQTGTNSGWVNWGLRRCVEQSNIYGNSATPPTSIYPYAIDGTGVDIVIQDSGIEVGHPEWEDAGGTTRLQLIDWYTASGLVGSQSANHYRDWDGHGTHCAGIAAGKTYGWAKGAHIYSQKLSGLELDGSTGISITDAFDTIRLWHNNKTNGRPTVVNMSWGYGATITTDPTNGVYRGTPWTWNVDYNDRNALFAAVGVTPNWFFNGVQNFHRIPVRVASVDAEIEDMITDGVHVCIAAGNNSYKVDVPGGADYDNTVTFSGTVRNYHRGSSPYSENAFMVGNIATTPKIDATVYRDRTADSTTRGPGVNIYAPGTGIMSTCSNINDGYTTAVYPGDTNYLVMSISGTSMAAPQVAGICAQYLQSRPELTPAELQAVLFADSQSVLFSTGSDTDYATISTSLVGSPNRMVYSRYGVAQPFSAPVANFNNLRIRLT